LSLIAGGWYAASLRPYAERFGDRLLVLIHDDMARDPATVYAAALRHVDASDDFAPADLDTIRFSNQPADRPSSALDADRRAELWTYFADDVKQLEDLIDRDLSFWAPAG
jgi:hypothetical protein